MGPQPAARTVGLTNPVMRTFQSVLSQPGIMSFGAGLMNPAGFDVAGVRAAFATALSDEQAPTSLQYGVAEAANGCGSRSSSGWSRSRFPPERTSSW